MIKDNLYNLQNNKPTLFSPSVIRNIITTEGDSVTLQTVNANDLLNTNIDSTSSFRYDLSGNGIKSTQQLNVDWSKFEEHTFFNSAQVKTNVAFDKIFNQFPFDGTRKETEKFFDELTGFENYVYEQMPKYKGYAFFSGSNTGETNAGTWITVKDIEGVQYPEISKETTGKSILNLETDSLTIENYLFFPSQVNLSQTIFGNISQSLIGYEGFALVASASSNINTASLAFFVSSGSKSSILEFDFPKSEFHHLALIWDRTPSVNKLFAYIDQIMVASSSGFEIKETFWTGQDFIIGSGSSFTNNSYIHIEQTTLSGAIDEFRLWHTVRNSNDRLEYQNKSIFSDDNLKLYFKFNEPPNCQSLVAIDSSGNSIHGKLNIAGNLLNVRQIATGSIAGPSPITYEKLNNCPILFAQIQDVSDLRNLLLTSASYYDTQNPNLITKLVPKHYFFEGQQQDALSTEEGPILTDITSTDELRSATLGGTQVLLSLLYVWAKYFDELKLFIETFGNLNFVDYDEANTVPDQFLQFLANQYGFTLPPMFTGTSIGQFINAENIQDEISNNTLNLQSIQNQIWRRILINLQDVVQSKGTIHSIKSFIRTLGIDPDNNFRIREFGGPTKAQLNWVRETRSEVASMLNFISGGYIKSSYLTASRVEPGYPYATNTQNDILLTSGSFSFEGLYNFTNTGSCNNFQSLMRVYTTSSLSESLNSNIIYDHLSKSLTFYHKNTSGSFMSLPITGVNLFDGNNWNICFGRKRFDDESDGVSLNSNISSSYFLRAGYSINGAIYEYHSTSSWIDTSISFDSFSSLSSSYNTSGSYYVIGSSSISQSSSPNFLNYDSLISTSKETSFQGRVAQIRFWSKFLEEKETTEHTRNFKSIGVQNPAVNFGFNTNLSGSWQRLRSDISIDQITTQSNNLGQLDFTDFSQNNSIVFGTQFPATSSIVQPNNFYFSLISPKFDEASTNNKVRARSFEDYNNVLSSSYASTAPLYELIPSERPTDTTKFTIDFSVVDALDQDMVNIFSTLDILDNILGNPELLFSPDYPELEFLRETYFNRLTEKMNLKLFFDFYKWFDTNIGVFISQLIPRKTKFAGVNYVIESHMLERPKMEYNMSDIYLGDDNRHGLKDTVLLQLINGNFNRY